MELETTESRLSRLLEKVEWPQPYMFKFIVPNHGGKVDQVTQILPESGKISFKHTPNLKYVSVTCVAIMHSGNQVVDITSKATAIDGVMAL